jgi:o-succinylbenzoate synthase
MKIWIHRYQLIPKLKGMKPRFGALVKAEWTNGSLPGYSDLHPWPEFGEPELEEHLKSLATVNLTPLAENSLEFNYIDREYRMNKKNAFAGLITPRSHKLIFDINELDPSKLQEIQKAGFSHLKIKLGRDLRAETENLVQLAYATNLLWRIDFNGKLTDTQAAEWWNGLDAAVKSRIDLIEDPCAEAQVKVQAPWANDWYTQKSALIRILKPAREGIEDLARYNRVIFTHGMDHTFGQACAAWAAARFYSAHPKKTDVCGLSSPELYLSDEFMRVWPSDGPRLKPTPGFGFGFDQQLEALKWEQVL